MGQHTLAFCRGLAGRLNRCSRLAQVIKRFIMHAKKTAFVVEHDFIMAAYLADRVMVYEGTPSKHAFARTPQSLLTGGCPTSEAAGSSQVDSSCRAGAVPGL